MLIIIGGVMPWSSIKKDMAFFRNITSFSCENKMNAVIMGRKTYFSIPEQYRPLDDRINIIITRNVNLREEENIPEDVIIVHSLEEALILSNENHLIDKVWVIGGGTIYNQAVAYKDSSLLDAVYITKIDFAYSGVDTYFIEEGFDFESHGYTLRNKSHSYKLKNKNFHFCEYYREGSTCEYLDADIYEKFGFGG
eukprot:TRINITY_DN784_c0_g1_i2.p1 TRINITY_DN784_c0_g1~~TRINITY_DN784_c0_g1_i2.p1  ORF type:complete len:195 (-),score=45.86 TRINITY_DN784_c0_g1_i2:61-645(-)